MNVNQMPKRANVHYAYAAGIAIKNSPVAMKISEMYDFIKVHMPAICTWKNDNWENCLRTYVTMDKEGFFLSISSYEGNSRRKTCTFTFKDGKKEEWEKKYPIDKYDPVNYLRVPGNHVALYNGQMGLPSQQQIERARVVFLQERAPWREGPRGLTPAQIRRAAEREQMQRQRQEMQRQAKLERQRQAELERQRQEELDNAVRGLEEFGFEEREEYEPAAQFEQYQNPQDYHQNQYEAEYGGHEYIPEEENADPMPQLEPVVYDNQFAQNQRYFAAPLQNQQQQRQQVQQRQRQQNLQLQVTPRAPKASPYNRPGSSKQAVTQRVRYVQRAAVHLSPQNRQQQLQNQVYDNYQNFSPQPAFQGQVYGGQQYNDVYQEQPQQNGYRPWGYEAQIPPHRLIRQSQVVLQQTPPPAPIQVTPHRLLRQSQSQMVLQPAPPPAPVQNQANYGNNDNEGKKYHNLEPVVRQAPPTPAPVQANNVEQSGYFHYNFGPPVVMVRMIDPSEFPYSEEEMFE